MEGEKRCPSMQLLQHALDCEWSGEASSEAARVRSAAARKTFTSCKHLWCEAVFGAEKQWNEEGQRRVLVSGEVKMGSADQQRGGLDDGALYVVIASWWRLRLKSGLAQWLQYYPVRS